MGDYLEKFKNQFVKIEDIFEYEKAGEATKNNIRMQLVRKAEASEIFRAGRGVYGFFHKDTYKPYISDTTKKITEILNKNFTYLDYIITDTTFLSHFMNLLPFVSTFVIETEEIAFDSILTTLSKSDIMAYNIKDFQKFDKYIKDTTYIILRPKLTSNPQTIKLGKTQYAPIEKILVDLLADEQIFSQYQEAEAENIYKGIIERYAVNYSKLLQYAKARNRKKECLELLELTNEFKKVEGLL